MSTIQIAAVDERLTSIEDRLKDLQKLLAKGNPAYLSRKDYSNRHGLSPQTIDRAIKEGRLAFKRTGRRVLIPLDAEIQPINGSSR